MKLPILSRCVLLVAGMWLGAAPGQAQVAPTSALPDAPAPLSESTAQPTDQTPDQTPGQTTDLAGRAPYPDGQPTPFPDWQPGPFTSEAVPQTLMPLASLPAPTRTRAALPPPPDDDDVPTFMKWLAERGHHNLENERWNAYGQITYIYGWKKAFYAPYTNADGSINSLLPTPEQSFTGTATLYLGARLWKGAEAYFVPELISEKPLSQLRGLGSAIQDFELQKGGSELPTLYSSRSYLRQTFNFGGEQQHQDSGPMSLAGSYDSRRLTLIAGDFSVLDFFDRNPFGIDPRLGSYFGLAFLTYSPWDFASNARGYSWGFLSEFDWDKWAVRYARLAPPKDPNQLPVDFRFFKYYGDQVEFERHHQIHGKDGTIRLLAFRNHEDIGKFSDAIAAFQANPAENATTCTGFNYGSNNATAPDLCWARKPNVKMGIGMYSEQYLTKDIGVFARGMYADGKTEVDAYGPTDRAIAFGTLAKGSSWGRPQDYAGVAVNIGWISSIHARYLGMGGVDGFIGDGHISAAPEATFDVFYTYNIHKSYWLSGDYQRVTNPAMNSARGPVDIFNIKVHAEF